MRKNRIENRNSIMKQETSKKENISSKRKYSDDEISKARYASSKAVFLVRDHIKDDNIDTKNKWIDVKNLKYKDKWDEKGNYDPEIFSFDTEIFDKTEIPIYSDEMTDEEKHQLTFEVAEGDIEKQKRQEKMNSRKINRPKYHVDVSSKTTKEHGTKFKAHIKKIDSKKK